MSERARGGNAEITESEGGKGCVCVCVCVCVAAEWGRGERCSGGLQMKSGRRGEGRVRDE